MQLEARSAELLLDWIPCDSNLEADALADGRFEGFSAELRVVTDIKRVKRLVLNKLLSPGEAFHK